MWTAPFVLIAAGVWCLHCVNGATIADTGECTFIEPECYHEDVSSSSKYAEYVRLDAITTKAHDYLGECVQEGCKCPSDFPYAHQEIPFHPDSSTVRKHFYCAKFRSCEKSDEEAGSACAWVIKDDKKCVAENDIRDMEKLNELIKKKQNNTVNPDLTFCACDAPDMCNPKSRGLCFKAFYVDGLMLGGNDCLTVQINSGATSEKVVAPLDPTVEIEEKKKDVAQHAVDII